MNATTRTNPPASVRPRRLAKWPALLLVSAAITMCGCADEIALSGSAGRDPDGPVTVPAVRGENSPGAAEPFNKAERLRNARTPTPDEGAEVSQAGAHAEADQAELEGDAKDSETEAQMWEIIEETFARKGELKDGVYRLVTPRTDLFVTMDGMDVPDGAFLESDFRFWRCPCGKLLVNGQFVLADYEVNDVVDELQEGRLDVVTIAPLLLHEHPRLLMVRFQGEGRTRAFAKALKSALSYTGEERNAPQPVDLSPNPE